MTPTSVRSWATGPRGHRAARSACQVRCSGRMRSARAPAAMRSWAGRSDSRRFPWAPARHREPGHPLLGVTALGERERREPARQVVVLQGGTPRSRCRPGRRAPAPRPRRGRHRGPRARPPSRPASVVRRPDDQLRLVVGDVIARLGSEIRYSVIGAPASSPFRSDGRRRLRSVPSAAGADRTRRASRSPVRDGRGDRSAASARRPSAGRGARPAAPVARPVRWRGARSGLRGTARSPSSG